MFSWCCLVITLGFVVLAGIYVGDTAFCKVPYLDSVSVSPSLVIVILITSQGVDPFPHCIITFFPFATNKHSVEDDCRFLDPRKISMFDSRLLWFLPDPAFAVVVANGRVPALALSVFTIHRDTFCSQQEPSLLPHLLIINIGWWRRTMFFTNVPDWKRWFIIH